MIASLLASILPLLGQVLAAALLAAATWTATRLADWLRLSADSHVRGYLLDIVGVAVEAAAATLRQVPDLREEIIRDAVTYVQERAPQALRRFGVTAPALEEMIEQRLAARVQG